MKAYCLTAILLLGFFLAPVARADHHGESAAPKLPYDVQEIKPGIFRTQQGPYYGIVVEGESGLLVFDTFSAHFSQWLDEELAKRFNKPVEYVVYSHNHPDHVSGGEVFAHHDPVYIAHDLAKESMERMGVPTHYPSLTFDTSLQIDFDGQRIEFDYWGQNDGLGSISMYVPDKKFIAAIDWALTDRVPYMELRRYNIDGIIRSLYAIDRLDWDLISPGHASTGNKDDVHRFRRYLEFVRQGVIDGIHKGHLVDEIVVDVKAGLDGVSEFTSLKMYDEWAEMNIRGIYRQIAGVEGILE